MMLIPDGVGLLRTRSDCSVPGQDWITGHVGENYVRSHGRGRKSDLARNSDPLGGAIILRRFLSPQNVALHVARPLTAKEHLTTRSNVLTHASPKANLRRRTRRVRFAV